MVRPLVEYFASVEASDVYDYGAGFTVKDNLFRELPEPADWTISNPPFRRAAQFIERALATSRCVARIVRAAFLEGQGRYERLFSKMSPCHVLHFTERVVMQIGRLAPEATTATTYAWLVWADRAADTKLSWIASCRKLLERESDCQIDERKRA